MGTAATGVAGQLGTDAFLRLLVTELRYQDPLRPVDDRAFLAQLAQLAAVERLDRLGERVERLAELLEDLRRGEAWQAAGLWLGRSARLADGSVVRIVGVGLGPQGVELLLEDGRRVGWEAVTAVLEDASRQGATATEGERP